MIKTISFLYFNEWKKLLKMKFFYIGPALSFIAGIIWMKGIESLSHAGNTPGFLYLSTGFQAAVTSIIPLFILIFSSLLIASESSKGTLKFCFFHPIGRMEFFLAKIMICFSFIFLMIFFNFLSLLITSMYRYQFTDITEMDKVIVSVRDQALSMLLTYILTLMPLLSIAAWGILVSTISKSLTAAIGFGVGFIFGLEPIRHFIKFDSFDPNKYIFMNYLDQPASVMNNLASGFSITWNVPEITFGCVILPLITITLFLTISILVFLKKDFKSDS